MSKYAPLRKHLAGGKLTRWRATFAEVEAVLEFSLPRSAYTYPAWWSNDATGHSHSLAWLDAGWKTQDVDLPNQQVTFVKHRGVPLAQAKRGRMPGGTLHGALKGVVQMVAGTDLTQPTGGAGSGGAP
jgi:hypothetical protein